MTDPKKPDDPEKPDGPKTPDDVIDAELVDPHAGRAGNRAWMTGGNGEGRGPLKPAAQRTMRDLRNRAREVLLTKGWDFLEAYIDDPTVDKDVKAAIVIKAMEFAMPKAKVEDEPPEGAGGSTTGTRTVTLRLVNADAGKKGSGDGNGG